MRKRMKQQKTTKLRRSGGDTVVYLRDKNHLMQKWKLEEMQLQRQQLEAQSKKEGHSKKQHQGLMQVMLQQTKQQQEQKFSADVNRNAAAAVSNYHKTYRKTKLSNTTLPPLRVAQKSDYTTTLEITDLSFSELRYSLRMLRIWH